MNAGGWHLKVFVFGNFVTVTHIYVVKRTMEKHAVLTLILSYLQSVNGDCGRVIFGGIPPNGYSGTVKIEVWPGSARFSCSNRNNPYFQEGKPVLQTSEPDGLSLLAFCKDDPNIKPIIYLEKYFREDFLIEEEAKMPIDAKFKVKPEYDILSTIPFLVKIYVRFCLNSTESK